MISSLPSNGASPTSKTTLHTWDTQIRSNSTQLCLTEPQISNHSRDRIEYITQDDGKFNQIIHWLWCICWHISFHFDSLNLLHRMTWYFNETISCYKLWIKFTCMLILFIILLSCYKKNYYLIPRYFICDIKTKIQYLIHKP